MERKLHLGAQELLFSDGSDYPWNRGPGVAIQDLTGDGWLDMVVTLPYRNSILYLNEGDGKLFRAKARLPAAVGVAAGDLDDDGDADLVFANRRSSADQILYNDGKGNFEEGEDLPNSLGESRTPILGDADGDGDLDLIISGFSTRSEAPETEPGDGHQLFLHEDTGWVEATDRLPSSVLSSLSYQIAWVDVDQDQDNDLYITNDFGAMTQPNQLLLNNGTGHFQVAEDCGCGLTMEGMGIGLGDADENGWLDMLLSDVEGVRLLEGEGGSFWEATGAVGANPSRRELGPTWGVLMADLDLDGRNDLISAAGRLYNEVSPEDVPDYETDMLMQAQPDGSYREVVLEDRETDASRSMVMADLDRDGHPDLVSTSLIGLQIWRNTTASPPAITVQVDGGPGNREGIGAKVEVEVGERILHRWIFPGTTYSSQPPELYVGLDGARRAEQIRVEMPDGRTAVATDVEAGTLVKLKPQ